MKVVHDKHRREFRIDTPSGTAVLRYTIDKGVIDVFHTFVPAEERGEGIATKLARACMAFAAEEGLRVRASCSYMVQFLGTHSEYAQLTED